MSKKCVTLTDLGLSDDKAVKNINGHHIVCNWYQNPPLTRDTKIYRYMRLSSLLNMLFDGQMHISNRQDFSDLREKKGLEKDIESILPFKIVQNYRSIQRQEKIKRETLHVCVSCWTLDRRSNNEIDDNYLMWKAYSKDEITCRIGTRIGKLIECIKDTPADIVISDVYYANNMGKNEYEDLIFRKSLHYEDEQEVRMVVLSNNRQGADLKIDCKGLLDEIKISPFVPPVLRYFIIRQLNEWCKKYKTLKIDQSSIMEFIETNKNYKRTKVSCL